MLVRAGQTLMVAIAALTMPLGAWSQQTATRTAVQSRVLEVDCLINPGSGGVGEVELWITADGGQKWSLAQEADGHDLPMQVRVDRDGLYGLFVVARNAVGASSGPPQAGERPHQWVLVDTAAPLVQVQQVRIVRRDPLAAPILVVSWSAYDAHPADRPVSLYYQTTNQAGWQLLARSVEDVGRFDWTVPATLTGNITVRVEFSDQAGNRGIADAPPVALGTALASGVTAAQASPALPPAVVAKPSQPLGHEGQPTARVPQPDPARAQELYDLAVWHKERGDYALAVERLVEAMNLGPEMLAPAYELANIYYIEGNYQGSLDIYERILDGHGDDRDALRGGAQALVALRKHPEAMEKLLRILRVQPGDAETWLDAGDVYLWMGQRGQARRYWEQVQKLSPSATDLSTKAQKRIKRYASP